MTRGGARSSAVAQDAGQAWSPTTRRAPARPGRSSASPVGPMADDRFVAQAQLVDRPQPEVVEAADDRMTGCWHPRSLRVGGSPDSERKSRRSATDRRCVRLAHLVRLVGVVAQSSGRAPAHRLSVSASAPSPSFSSAPRTAARAAPRRRPPPAPPTASADRPACPAPRSSRRRSTASINADAPCREHPRRPTRWPRPARRSRGSRPRAPPRRPSHRRAGRARPGGAGGTATSHSSYGIRMVASASSMDANSAAVASSNRGGRSGSSRRALRQRRQPVLDRPGPRPSPSGGPPTVVSRLAIAARARVTASGLPEMRMSIG